MQDEGFLIEVSAKNHGASNQAPVKNLSCAKPGDQPRGTLFFGGVDLKRDYIPWMIKALRDSGIRDVMYINRNKWSLGSLFMDSCLVIKYRHFDPLFPYLLSNLKSHHASQFNLIGYSYGSLLVAQLAVKYACKGTCIHHLVLISSPISKSFLKMLHKTTNIEKVIVVNLNEQGDSIKAGISAFKLIKSVGILALQFKKSIGHFYYTLISDEGQKRREDLAYMLYEKGLR